MLIDVRSTQEYQRGHRPGSANIPLEHVRDINVPKDTPILLYCKSGGRAEQAKSILLAMGYTDVTNLGGF